MKAGRTLQAAKERFLAFQIALFILTPVLLSSAAIAEDLSPSNHAGEGSKQIQIVADKLITDNEQKFAEFTGNVRASQGNLVITSDRLKIYYKQDEDGTNQQTSRQESIKQIVAGGNVTVATERYTAETDRVEYDVITQVVVLIGENSTVKSGKNILTGSKITVDRKTGQMKVDSNPHKRVKAVFYPDKNTEKKE